MATPRTGKPTGRPPYVPTPQQRQMVEAMAGYGSTHDEIRVLVGVGSRVTFRRVFKAELKLAAIKANTQVAQSLFSMATKGRSPAAAIFWLKVRAGWRETVQLANAPESGPFEVVYRWAEPLSLPPPHEPEDSAPA